MKYSTRKHFTCTIINLRYFWRICSWQKQNWSWRLSVLWQRRQLDFTACSPFWSAILSWFLCGICHLYSDFFQYKISCIFLYIFNLNHDQNHYFLSLGAVRSVFLWWLYGCTLICPWSCRSALNQISCFPRIKHVKCNLM